MAEVTLRGESEAIELRIIPSRLPPNRNYFLAAASLRRSITAEPNFEPDEIRLPQSTPQFSNAPPAFFAVSGIFASQVIFAVPKERVFAGDPLLICAATVEAQIAGRFLRQSVSVDEA